jgi:acetyl esterase/lipase
MVLNVNKNNIDYYTFSYQLTPSVHYPTPIDEGVKVTRHVMDNYQEYGIDPTHVFLCGDSAGISFCFYTDMSMFILGGNMAVVVERHLRHEQKPTVRGVLLLYPLLQLVNFRLSSYRTYLPYRLLSVIREDLLVQVANFYVNTSFSVDELFNNRHLSLDDYNKFYSKININNPNKEKDDISTYQLLSETSHPDTWKLFNENISPLLANDDILRNSPPTFIVACTYDVLLSDAQLYFHRLQQLDVKNVIYREYRIFHGVMTFVDFPVAFNEAFDIINDSAQFVVNRTTLVK